MTLPLNEPVDRYESSPGISIEKLGVWSLVVKPPIWNNENAHEEQSFHCASAPEIFIGWRLVTRIPK